jgi:hypothetical protein
MSLEKTELTAHIANEIGADIEDLLEQADKAMQASEGVSVGLARASKGVNGILGHVDKALDEGELDLEQSTLVKRWLSRCSGSIEGLKAQAEVERLQARGYRAGVARAMETARKRRDMARVKAESVRAYEAGEGSSRPSGVRPENPLADRERRKPAEEVDDADT